MTACLLVTGAAGELGQRALAVAATRSGIGQVIATTRSRALRHKDPKVTCLGGLDLGQEADVQRLAAILSEGAWTRIGVVHCAGGFPPAAPLHGTALSDVGETFAANVLTFLGVAKAVIPAMRRQRRGGLVAFTSHTQAAAYPFLGAFNLSKVALLSAVQTLANENARWGIAANAVAIATLQTETERRIKPGGRYTDWVPAESAAAYAIDLALSENSSVNGAEIQYWTHSHSFFGSSVFERNSLDPEQLDPAHD